MRDSLSRRRLLRLAGFGAASLAMRETATAADMGDPGKPPNFIIVLCDNLGYGDLGCFGSTKHRTPHVDRMAAAGLRLTGFYATSGVCTPSRASLMTGCYPRRVNLHVSNRGGAVLMPVSAKGLHPDEITIAEALKGCGYATACIGKWHLGDQAPFLPTRQGFDSYFGIPYSDDMVGTADGRRPPLPLMRGETVVEAPVDCNTLTKRYTEEAIGFITANRDRPFFLYLAHAMPGSTPRPFASEAFRGRSANGPYGDAVEEVDWSTGEILAALGRLGLDADTLVLWTSDNGAVQRNPPQGSNAPLRGWGYTTAEGGMRVPCAVRWPGRVPPGAATGEICTVMDVLPTFALLAGARAPADRAIDGKDIWPILSGRPGAASPHEALYYYFMDQLQAVRAGPWKLYLPLEGKKIDFRGGTQECRAQLYDLQADVGEAVNLADRRPEVVARLAALAEKARRDLGDGGRDGEHQRPAGFVADPKPMLLQARPL
jgi:arylsulfatase A-like enzyme